MASRCFLVHRQFDRVCSVDCFFFFSGSLTCKPLWIFDEFTPLAVSYNRTTYSISAFDQVTVKVSLFSIVCKNIVQLGAFDILNEYLEDTDKLGLFTELKKSHWLLRYACFLINSKRALIEYLPLDTNLLPQL